jgi:hypothetical protein
MHCNKPAPALSSTPTRRTRFSLTVFDAPRKLLVRRRIERAGNAYRDLRPYQKKPRQPWQGRGPKFDP